MDAQTHSTKVLTLPRDQAGQEDSNKTPQPNRKVSSQDPITMN